MGGSVTGKACIWVGASNDLDVRHEGFEFPKGTWRERTLFLVLADRLLGRNVKRQAPLIKLRWEKLTFIEISTCQALCEAFDVDLFYGICRTTQGGRNDEVII